LYIHLKLGMLPPRDVGAGEPRIQTAQTTCASAPAGPKLAQSRETLLAQNHPARRLPVYAYPEEPELVPSWATGIVQDGRKNDSNGNG